MAWVWSRGYEITSVRELAESMGMTSANLYHAFGNKLGLYRRALQHCVDIGVRERVYRRKRMAPRKSTVAILGEIIEKSLINAEHKRRMLVIAALEVAPHDPVFRLVAAQELRNVVAFFRSCVMRDYDNGDIPPAVYARDSAWLLLSVLLGARALERSRLERGFFEGVRRSAFESLKRPAALL